MGSLSVCDYKNCEDGTDLCCNDRRSVSLQHDRKQAWKKDAKLEDGKQQMGPWSA